jgi:hypothetical protein
VRADLLLDVALRTMGPGTPVHGSLRNAGWFVGEDIPAGKLQRAREAYAPYDAGRETPVVLYDLTVFGSAKRGLLLTTGALYYAMTSAVDGFSEVTGRLALTTIRRLEMVDAELHVNAEAVGRLIRPDREDGEALGAFFRQMEEAASGLAPAIAGHDGGPVTRILTAEAADAIFAAIRGLKRLYDEDAITHDEFQAKKQDLLGRL